MRRLRRSGGFLLLETMLTVAVIAIALTALVAVVRLLTRANSGSEASSISTHLSLKLLEEIRLRRWDETTPTPPRYTRRRSAINTDGGESSTTKLDFDDIDDFDGWREAPPRDPVMGIIPDFDEYTSTVTVRYVNITTLAPGNNRTDLKMVSVCTWRRGRKSVCLNTLIGNR